MCVQLESDGNRILFLVFDIVSMPPTCRCAHVDPEQGWPGRVLTMMMRLPAAASRVLLRVAGSWIAIAKGG